MEKNMEILIQLLINTYIKSGQDKHAHSVKIRSDDGEWRIKIFIFNYLK